MRSSVLCSVLACGGLEFRCASGECVHLSLRCNGRQDCQDGSDEACGCSEFCTGPREFLCHDNLCLTGPGSSPRCDGLSQCSDGSDEFSCPAAFCPEGEWRCQTGHCIPAVHRCDGTSQCPDMSDEVQCGSSCGEEDWECQDRSSCIPASLRCDGTVQCPDLSDEAQCRIFNWDWLVLAVWCGHHIVMLEIGKKSSQTSDTLSVLYNMYMEWRDTFKTDITISPNCAVLIITGN